MEEQSLENQTRIAISLKGLLSILQRATSKNYLEAKDYTVYESVLSRLFFLSIIVRRLSILKL
jgi:hypothetical protein